MSISTSGLAKELKKLLSVETNAEVLERVQKLQAPTPAAVIVAVAWRPGEAQAVVSILSNQDAPMAHVAEALRRGEAVVMGQMERLAMQAQSEAARLRAELKKASAAEGTGRGSQDEDG